MYWLFDCIQMIMNFTSHFLPNLFSSKMVSFSRFSSLYHLSCCPWFVRVRNKKGKIMSHLSVVSHLSIVSQFQSSSSEILTFPQNESPENNSKHKTISYSQSHTVWYFWWTWSFENRKKGTWGIETKWSPNKSRILGSEQENFQNFTLTLIYDFLYLKIW